jgi:hypothetical protein
LKVGAGFRVVDETVIRRVLVYSSPPLAVKLVSGVIVRIEEAPPSTLTGVCPLRAPAAVERAKSVPVNTAV